MTDLEKVLDIAGGEIDSFFLLKMDIFEKNYRDFLNAFRKYWENTVVAYSFKTNYIPDLCKRILELGGSAEVVSDMELSLAEQVGFKGRDIYFNGPYKQGSVIERFLLNEGNLNVDSNCELRKVIAIAEQHPKKQFRIALRCALDIGQEKPSRFGFDIHEMNKAIQTVDGISNLEVVGIHTHLPFRSIESFSKRLTVLRHLLNKYSKKESLQYLSIGGGYMGPMADAFAWSVSGNHHAPSFEDYARIIGHGLATCLDELQIRPKLILEPGSALVANAMSFFARVESIKTVKGKTYITVVASTFNMNPTVRGINRPIDIHNRGSEPCVHLSNADIVGFTCIEGDCLFHGYEGDIAVGDFVEFHNIGSYSVTMNPAFIRPLPAIINKASGLYTICKYQDEPTDVFARYTLFQ